MIGTTAIAEAAARSLFKLMAYKDEYEVARLYTDGSFVKQVAREFDGENLRFEFHLAPPLLARRTGCEPFLDPLPDRDLVGRDMFAGIAGPDQGAQFLPGFCQRAVESLGEPPAVNSVAKPEDVLAALVNARINRRNPAASPPVGRGLRLVFVGLFEEATRAYGADIRAHLPKGDSIQTTTMAEVAASDLARRRVDNADLILTLFNRKAEVATLVGPKKPVLGVRPGQLRNDLGGAGHLRGGRVAGGGQEAGRGSGPGAGAGADRRWGPTHGLPTLGPQEVNSPCSRSHAVIELVCSPPLSIFGTLCCGGRFPWAIIHRSNPPDVTASTSGRNMLRSPCRWAS